MKLFLMNKVRITKGIIMRLALLVLPIAGITLWFLNDGGFGFGWNLIWYWTWIIGFLLVYQVVLLVNYVLNHKKEGYGKEHKIFIWIGLLLLAGASIFFMLQLK